MQEQRGLFAELLVRHDRALLKYIMAFVPRRDDAEEILQRAAIVLWEKFAEYDREREFLPWAVRFAYFEVLNFRKENARSRLVFCEDLLYQLAETRQAYEPLLEARREALRECLKKLTAPSRALLHQRYADSISIASLAEGSGRPAKALYRRLYKLRLQIGRCIQRQLAAESS